MQIYIVTVIVTIMALHCPRCGRLQRKSSVLILDLNLNEPRVVAALTFAESLLQTAGAATKKERSSRNTISTKLSVLQSQLLILN